MTYNLPKAPPPNTIILRIKTSVYEFGKSTNIRSKALTQYYTSNVVPAIIPKRTTWKLQGAVTRIWDLSQGQLIPMSFTHSHWAWPSILDTSDLWYFLKRGSQNLMSTRHVQGACVVPRPCGLWCRVFENPTLRNTVLKHNSVNPCPSPSCGQTQETVLLICKGRACRKKKKKNKVCHKVKCSSERKTVL